MSKDSPPRNSGTPDADQFSREWIAGWNAHDLDAVLAHFHDDAVFTSPIAAQLVPASGGVIRGKAALRAYWTEGLKRNPELHFTLLAVYVGVNTLAIHYLRQKGDLANEVLIFDGDLVREGHATYSQAPG
jgi:hypothetical protein